MKRQRLDKFLVASELARSRAHAKELIEEERVWVDGFPAHKPATLVDPDAHVEVRDQDFLWVGRGGRKIWPFIRERGWIDPADEICLDVGASTGGFTQALLRAGARKVYAVDVGYGQLDYDLRRDDRLAVMDRYNFRHADPGDFDPPPSLFTMDVSFISTTKLLDALNAVTTPDAEGLVLIKPQFEAGPDENVDGIVRDPEVIRRVLVEVCAAWTHHGWGIIHLEPAPLEGREGNQEFMAHVRRGSDRAVDPEWIDEIVG